MSRKDLIDKIYGMLADMNIIELPEFGITKTEEPKYKGIGKLSNTDLLTIHERISKMHEDYLLEK